MRTTVLVVGDSEHARPVAAEIEDDPTLVVHVHGVPGVAELEEWSGLEEPATPHAGAGTPDRVVLVLLVPGEGQHIDSLVEAVLAHPACKEPRILLVTDRLQLDDVSRALDSRHVHGIVAVPWTPGMIASYARAQVSRWLHRHSDAQEAPAPPSVGSDLLRLLEMPVAEVARDLLAAIEEVLGARPRLHLPAGVHIAREGKEIDQIFLVVSGRVQLTVNSPLAGRVMLNHASTGPVVGLVALAEQVGAMVSASTTTPCEMVPLTVEQLDFALDRNPRVGALLTALTIRVLSNRLRKAHVRRVEKTELATKLRLTLDELEQARADLVAQARMATLGELAAGIAHELNNPVAAVARSAQHLGHDLPGLLSGDPLVAEVLEKARGADRLDARSERAARRALGAVVADPVLVRRLVAAGVTDPEQARRLTRRRAGGAVERVELAAGVGGALHSLDLAAGHIAALVDGLRHHARPDGPDGARREALAVDETVDAALRLLEHRLRGHRVRLHRHGTPHVLGDPAQLTQVWTNLLTNAADALGDAGTIDITVEDDGSGWVRVKVVDDGPGVPEALREQIFDPRFTTKHGVVRFGLGLGLGIARTIVAAHGGTIELESRPGQTCFAVRLPAVTG